MVLIPNWERVVVGNLSDKLGPNWELGPNYAAAANSVGIGWESGSPKNSVGAPKIAKMRFSLCRDHFRYSNPRPDDAKVIHLPTRPPKISGFRGAPILQYTYY